jgi:glycerol-3-phosphate acyltransferase PlsX
MSQNYIIALDAMGGDYGPSVVIPAAEMALKKLTHIRFLLVGDEAQIRKEMESTPLLRSASEIIHTDKVIPNDMKASVALRAGRDSSLRLAIDAVKEGRAHGVVSGGNTGALMATAKMVLKCLPGINRPAIASVFPTVRGDTVMLDLGANLQCDAEILVQFAVLGTVFARITNNVKHPTVGLLNVGSEDMKGHDQVRKAAAVLSNVNIPGHYYGFIEGNDIPAGTTDVVVTDGFTGNIALKVAEGVGSMTSQLLREALGSSLISRLGALLAYGALKRMKNRVDHRRYNGGMFLGLNGVCVKSHGGMDAFGFSHAIEVAANLVEHDYNSRVAAEIEQLMGQESFINPEG